MDSPLRIYAEVRGHGGRGPRYQVRMNKPDGTVLVEATTQPLHDAARVLMSRGVTGKLQLWDKIKPYWRMQGDIERLSGLTVTEGLYGIAIRRYAERHQDGKEYSAPVPNRATPNGRPCLATQGSGDILDIGIDIGEIPARSTPRSASRSAVPV